MASQDELPIFEKICLGCRGAAAASELVKVDSAALESVASEMSDSLARVGPESYTKPLREFPVRFDGDKDEAQFYFVLFALDFGSGFGPLLAASGGKSAEETVQYGMLGMAFNGSAPFRADRLVSFEDSDVSKNFSLQLKEDVRIKKDSPIYKEQGSSVKPYAEMIGKTMREIGENMWKLQCEDFLEYVKKYCANPDGGAPLASTMVEKLMKHFPCMSDTAGEVEGVGDVVFAKKALLVVIAFYRRFGQRLPEMFGFSDVEKIPMPIGQAIPGKLRKWGVLKYDESLEKAICSGKGLKPGSKEEVAIRAGAFQACEGLVELIGRQGRPIYAYQLLPHLLGELGSIQGGKPPAQDEDEAEGEGGESRERTCHITVGTLHY